jgi:hypothetical protein
MKKLCLYGKKSCDIINNFCEASKNNISTEREFINEFSISNCGEWNGISERANINIKLFTQTNLMITQRRLSSVIVRRKAKSDSQHNNNKSFPFSGAEVCKEKHQQQQDRSWIQIENM